MQRLQQTLTSTYSAPKEDRYSYIFHPERSKLRTSSRLNKSLQDNRFPREVVTWGVHKNDNHYDTSYEKHYKPVASSNIMKKVFIEPASPPPNHLSASFIPYNTPKFTTSRKNERSRNASDLSSSESPRGGRKQFPEFKHKDDYTKDDSPDSYRLFNNDHVMRKYSPNNPAQILKKMHLHHSQVHENFMSSKSFEYDGHVQLYSDAFDELNSAGRSDLKKRMNPSKSGKKLFASPRDESNLKDILRHSYSSCDNVRHTRKEFELAATAPVQSLKLRKPEYHERYTRSFFLCKSTAPNGVREGSVQSRKSTSPERSFSPNRNESFRHERLNESVEENRLTPIKSFSDVPSNLEQSQINNNSLLINKSYADTSILRTLPETDAKTDKSFRSIPVSSQSMLKTPAKNYEEYKKMRDQPSKEIRSPVKSKTMISQPPKRVSATTAFLSGRVKQGAFSGINKKYLA